MASIGPSDKDCVTSIVPVKGRSKRVVVMLQLLSICSNILLHGSRSPRTRSIGFVAIAAVSLSSIAYLTFYCLPVSSSSRSHRALGPPSLLSSWARGPTAFQSWESPQRLIVFGDSWSDNGRYPIDPPSQDQVISRDAQQGQVWTDWLCAMVSTSCI